MATVIVPFRGSAAKQRLAQLPETLRGELARAMLEDVLAAAREVGRTLLVAPERIPGAELVLDPGRGQGAAVEAGLAAAGEGPVLIVNSDLPCVSSRDLFTLLGALPPNGLALVEARDGTTNALALAAPRLFEPLYGPGSAERYRALGDSRTLEIPNLVDDVDTVYDLERLADRLGRRTRAALAGWRVEATG
jgi:2-phospho-L-lactate guanylyltransferase